MTDLDVELAALRTRRYDPSLYARLRRMRVFDRRAIREPSERDAYWSAVQHRLAAIDHEARALYADGPPNPMPLDPPISGLLGVAPLR
jgi:hypothetical protein